LVKYGAKGKVFEKIYLSKEGGVRRLWWNDMYSDWSTWLEGKGLEEINVKLATFRKHVQQEYNVVSRFLVPISAIFVEGTKSSFKMRKIQTRGEFLKKILKNINAMQVMCVILFTTHFKNPVNSSGKF